MYLKSLELHGFKSFPNKTVLSFEKGTTVVVGPNGSGKSNISDAMRWVLGELSSRNIRGTKMEDVIFGGTDMRRPMSFAEVSVTFDNSSPEHRMDSPYDEITVTRRYYRSGESEYMINRKNCRLRDIHELFMNTGVGREGYSIIGQGKIAEILSKKSEDRRNIFEEAAGISKFRQRKEETEKKLSAVAQNVESLTLIFNELDARIGPLARDAEKARKYRVLLEDKKRADVSLWLFDTVKLKSDLQKADEAYRLAKAEYERLMERIESLEKQSDLVHDRLTGSRLASEQLMTQISETTKRIGVLENAYALAIGSIKNLGELTAQCRERLSGYDDEGERIEAQKKELLTEIANIEEKEREEDDARLALLLAFDELSRAAQALEASLAEELAAIEELNAKAMDLRVRLDVSERAKADDSDKSASISEEIDKYRKAEAELSAEVARCEKNTAGFRERIDRAEAIIKEQTEVLEGALLKKEDAQRKHNEVQGAVSGLAQRIDSLRRMEEHFDGYVQSVRFVMQEYTKDASRFRGAIYGPVSKLISVEEKYITAIETALGQSLQNIVVEDEETAKSAIAVLKQHNAGRATFYPISAIRAQSETDEIRRAASFRGYVGRADRLIGFDARYKEIMESLLLRTVVFDNIDNATAAAKSLNYRVRIVTLDGQLINAGGSFTGGSVRRDSGILSRNTEIDALLSQKKEKEARVAALEKTIHAQEDEAEAARNKIRDAEQNRDLLYTMSRAQFAELDSAKAKLEANAELLSKLEEDRERLRAGSDKYDSDIRALQAALEETVKEIDRRRELRSELEIKRQEALDAREAKGAEINESKLRLAVLSSEKEGKRTQIESLGQTLLSRDESRAATERQIAEYAARMAALEEEKHLNRTELAEEQKRLAELEAGRSDKESEGDEYTKLENELREKLRAANDERERVYGESARCEGRLVRLREDNERLENKLWDEYQISYEEAVALDYPPVTAQNRAEMAALQSSCKSKIRELGNVNPNAVEEYEAVSGRHAELQTQLADLAASKEELVSILSRIEDEMEESFRQTFDQINENFGIVFSELFGGGQAELSLTDPENILTSGIEIKAAPPGKIIKSLSLLSGGEQTIVAIALIFAILKTRPSPFCIFDEIEAALDEVNVGRFGAYVRKYSENTQFILITHRRGTMEIGDRLYGITMPERGISRAVPFDVSEIESKQKELLT
ncbi:MAG: chromosome segregation protein SMC [Clostridia bacterium]|nr:chromosome segregation protein SMC [Clostridia bacterium]